MRRLELFFDLSCPYAWMGFHRAQDIAARYPVELVYRPVLLGGIFRDLEAPQVPAESWSAERQRMIAQDLVRQASRLGLDLQFPAGHPRRTVQALRLILSAPKASWHALITRLYAAYWERKEDLSDPAVLQGIAQEFGLDLSRTQDPEIKALLKANTDEALHRGVFGVPAFFLEGEEDGAFYWGQDRLHFLEKALGGPQGYQAPVPRPIGEQELHWYFDFSSPFGYLSSLRVRALAAAAGVKLVPKPFLLGALFKGIGTPMIPMATFPPPKVRYLARDLKRWAAWWGGPFEFTKTFPLRTVLPLRVALQDHAAIQPLYAAAWADNRDIGQPEIVHAVLREAGLDADALIQGAQSPAIKQQLKDNTAQAQALGVPGVPTFKLPDGQLVWGQDRMDVVASLLEG